MASNKKAAVGFIFITILIDVIGLGLIIPVVPKLIEELLHNSSTSLAAQYGGWLTFSYAIMQVYCFTNSRKPERPVWQKTHTAFFLVWIWP